MSTSKISLNDKYDIEKHQVLLNGTQALVRLMIAQKERDRQAGLNTAGYVTGYRGSPLGAVDFQMKRAGNVLPENDITFQEGLNEDLAATALWGAQQAELRGEGRFDGVFGLWYGKGPGVDRSGDVMRHANMAGSSKNGGVIMALGDDHTGKVRPCCTNLIGPWWMHPCPLYPLQVSKKSWITDIMGTRCHALRVFGLA